MTNRPQILRSSTPGQTPAAGTRAPGELWTTFPDLQLGVIDVSRNAQRLIAVRYFSTLANYAVGDFVVQGGALYVANAAIIAGAFNATQWTKLLTASDGAALPYLPLAGGTVVGGTAFTAGIILASPSNLNIGGGAPGQVLTRGTGAGQTTWANSGSTVSVGDTPPASPRAGDLWWDSVGGQMYVWFADANSSQWVSTNNSGGVVASMATPLANGVAAVGTSLAYARADHTHPGDGYTHDNRIINGDMRIDQRNNGAAGTAINVYTADRWKYSGSLAAKGTWQRSTGPAALAATGFPYFLQFTSSSAYTPLAADFFNFFQPIEADAVSDFAWGTANAQPVTLSFWASSSQAGTFSGVVQNYASTRSYPFSFPLPTSTWTKVVITIPGDTAGTWVMSGAGGALALFFDLGSGATYRAPAGAWAAGNFVGANGAASVVSTNAAAFYLTGVKLEIGNVATPFNRQSLAKSMSDCQRYFLWLPINMRFMATTGSQVMQAVSFPAMRASPAIGAQVADPNLTPGAANVASVGIGNITPYSVGMQLTPNTTGDSYMYGYRASASAEL